MPDKKTGPDPIDIAVGSRIRMQRRTKSVSQSELARALGLTFQQVQKYERGTNRVSASMLVRIAAKLESSVAALVGENEGVDLDLSLYQHLGQTGAIDLLEHYSQIKDADAKRALVTLARTLAKNAYPRL